MPFPTDVDATWVNPDTVTMDAGELRRADSTMFAGDGTTNGVRGGVVQHSDNALQVSVSGADVVTLTAGACVLPGNAVEGTGPYRTALSADISGNLSARNATNPRIDLVIARQLDADVVGAHGAYTARFDIIAGVASATPDAPDLPAMAIELARINVPAVGSDAAVVDTSHRMYAVGAGGILPVPTAAALPAIAPKRQRAVALDTGAFYDWDGTEWIGGTQAFAPATTASFTYVDGSILRIGQLAAVDLSLTYDGATITATAAGGNVADITILPAGSIPTMYRPTNRAQYIRALKPGLASGTARVNSDGSMTLTDMGSGTVLNNGDSIYVQGVWPIL